ncbi:hypothetical protein N665_0107s0013 [Sinapis alba]|nr:hypothetical protein N665_0107s0013 [Sinapis alba]
MEMAGRTLQPKRKCVKKKIVLFLRKQQKVHHDILRLDLDGPSIPFLSGGEKGIRKGDSRGERRRVSGCSGSGTMATRRSKRGKAAQLDATEEKVEDVKALLPERLFATDRFSSERVNIYSTVDYLLRVKEALMGTPEMEVLAGSSFGGLFKMLARRLLAGKVIHSMLTRQVVTKKKFEMWPVFGGKPLRFSLAEFGEVMGLPVNVTIEELMRRVETDPDMPGWMNLRLCLLVIVEGVLVASVQKPKPALKHVERIENLEDFFPFPWGRESFAWTISTMKPGPKVMALHLVAFEVIPQLLEQVGGDRCVSVLDFPAKSLPHHAGLTLADMQKAEHSPELTVQPILDSNVEHEERWGVWDEEKYDKKVEYMLRLVSEGHMFSKADWGGRRNRPARRMSEYFKRGAVIDGGKHANLEKQVEELVQEVVMLKADNVKHGKQLSKLRKAVKKLIGNAGSRRHRRKGKKAQEDSAKSVGDPRCSVSVGKKDDDDDAEEAALLVRLREGEGVPPEWVEGGTTCTGEKGWWGGGQPGEGINMQESVRLDALVSVVLADLGEDLRSPALEEKEVLVDVANKKEEGMGKHSGLYGGQVEDVDKEAGSVDEGENKQVRASSGGEKEEVVDRVTVYARVDDNLNEQVGASVHDTTEKKNEQIGSDVDEEEKDVEGGGVGGRAEVSESEQDCDFPFFEKVLQDNAAVVHLNAGGYNLDNQFFLDLATPSVQHIYVLMEHIEQRHAPTLHHNKAMFMSPWFTAHVQGKTRSFKAAKCKARVAGDVKITKYLTRDGQRWGADMDTLYAPMIWGGGVSTGWTCA